MGHRQVNFWLWVASKLPKKLVYFCTLYLIASVTTGKYSNTVVPVLTAMAAIQRYDKDNGIESSSKTHAADVAERYSDDNETN